MDPMTRILIFLALLGVAVFAFLRWSDGGTSEPPADVAAAIAAGAQVIDARTESEYASSHVVGARNANVLGGDFRQRVDDLDRDEPVYVYCASGHRSGRAAAILEEMGFDRVVNAGGLAELAGAGVPVE